MKYLFGLPLLCLIACAQPQPEEFSRPLLIEHKAIAEQRGQCEAYDTVQSCARIDLHYPVLTQRDHPLYEIVRLWSFRFLANLIDPSVHMEEIPDDQTLQQLIASFFTNYETQREELPDLPLQYTLECSDSVLLNDGEYLSLWLKGYSYTGGAHPNSYMAAATFECGTGHQLSPSDVVTDMSALKKKAMLYYRKIKNEEFKNGFEFSSDWPFELPSAMALTPEGILMAYMPYEVAPYAMGEAIFVIPYQEIEPVLSPTIKEWRDKREKNHPN